MTVLFDCIQSDLYSIFLLLNFFKFFILAMTTIVAETCLRPAIVMSSQKKYIYIYMHMHMHKRDVANTIPQVTALRIYNG